jgi:mono/diheme cytochrome c family protein
MWTDTPHSCKQGAFIAPAGSPPAPLNAEGAWSVRELEAPNFQSQGADMKRIVTALAAVLFATAAYADGAATYAAKCKMCHGPAGEGTKMAGAVKGKSAAEVKKAITHGVAAAGGKKEMKAVKIADADVDAVAAFVAGLK